MPHQATLSSNGRPMHQMEVISSENEISLTRISPIDEIPIDGHNFPLDLCTFGWALAAV